MSKIIQSNKEPKKQAATTPKEKKVSKQVKVKLAKKQIADIAHPAFLRSSGVVSKVDGS